MASPAQIAANRINSAKSTGARTPEGQAKSSMNALKHGLRSKKVELMHEESYVFENRLRKWSANGDAQTDMDEFLIHRNVCLSFDIERAENARLQRCRSLIENSDEDELTEIHQIGARLFFDPSGPTPLYGNPRTFGPKKKTSWNGEAVNPNDPAVLVRRLERSEAGCRWLKSCWEELLGQLERRFWQSHDRLKAVRLLGREPVAAIEDRNVLIIFVASAGLNPVRKNEFDDLLSDLDEDQRDRYRKALAARWPELFRARDKAEWRQMLLDLVQQNIERLNARLDVHEANADAVAEQTFARLSFDPSPEGAAMRNYQMKSLSALFRGMENYRKHKSRTSGGGNGADGVGRREREQYPSADTRWATQGTDDRSSRSFVPHDGQAERLEPAVDSTDWLDREPQSACDTDEAPAAVWQNQTNEANFYENMNLIQDQGFVEVTAISDVDSGLDNGVIRPCEASEPGQADCGTAESADAISENETTEAIDENVSAAVSTELSDREVQPACGTAETTDAVSENETTEANLDAHVNITQEQGPVDVVADSGVPSGLDNSEIQPGEARVPEQEEVRKSRSEIGSPESQNPDLDDPAGGGRSPATFPKQERRPPTRRETERTKVERLVEEKLKAGCTSLREILNSVMTTTPSESGTVGRNPPRSP